MINNFWRHGYLLTAYMIMCSLIQYAADELHMMSVDVTPAPAELTARENIGGVLQNRLYSLCVCSKVGRHPTPVVSIEYDYESLCCHYRGHQSAENGRLEPIYPPGKKECCFPETSAKRFAAFIYHCIALLFHRANKQALLFHRRGLLTYPSAGLVCLRKWHN